MDTQSEEDQALVAPQMGEFVQNIRDTVLQGSFMPAAAVGETLDLNSFPFDIQQKSLLVHYLGHFGNVKALRHFETT